METLAAVGLVCNILQLAGTAAKAIALCKQVYENGASIAQLDFQGNCSQLQKSCETLDNKLKTSQNDEEIRIRDIARQYLKTAKKLEEEINKLNLPSSANHTSGRLQRARNAIESPLRLKRIHGIKSELDEYQRVMDTQILTQLR